MPRVRFSLSLLLCFFLVLARLANAQLAPRDSLPRITSIMLDRQDIFDRTETGLLPTIVNALHFMTRAPFVRRELLFHVGERYDSAAIAESKRNLRAFRVFRDVAIDSATSDSGVAMHVVTRDGWTTHLDGRIRSTGGSVVYTAAVIEDNFLGTLTQTGLLYQKDPDRSTTVLRLVQRRLIGDQIGGTLQYANRSDGKLFFAQMALPYFAVASRVSATLTFDDRDDRIYQYRAGMPAPHDTLQNRYVLVRGDFGRALRASSSGFLRVGLAAQVRRDDYVPDAAYQANGMTTSTVTGAVGVYVSAEHVNKPSVVGFQTFNHEEDIDLSPTITLSLFAAPKVFGYSHGHSGLAPGIAAHIGTQFPGGFAYADGVATGMYTSAGLDSGQVYLGGTAVLLANPRRELVNGQARLLPSSRHQLILHGEVSAIKNPLPGTEFDLGLGAGPRAFTQHSFSGDREFFATAEYRYTVAPDLFKLVGLGLAAFADRGGAWWSGDAHRAGWDFGVGLRLGITRVPDLEANRFDLSWRAAHDGIPGGWVFSVGKGFVFSTGLRGTSR